MAKRPLSSIIQSSLVVSSSLLLLSCEFDDAASPSKTETQTQTHVTIQELDTDQDSVIDRLDDDDDNDGVVDQFDAFPLDATESQDTDNDGVGDNADDDLDNDGHTNSNDAFPADSLEWADGDLDGIGDNTDDDLDNDTYKNDIDVFPTDATEWADIDLDGIGDNADTLIDQDNDTYSDATDAFPNDATEWSDFDEDGLGDNSDPDIDNDSVLNEDDADSFNPLILKDTDHDGVADATDVDIDGDGVINDNDAEPFNPLVSVDKDLDGIDDSMDDFIDSDDDQVADNEDAFPNDSQRSSCDMPNDVPIYGEQQIRLLLSHEYANTISDILNIEVDISELPYDNIIFQSFKTGNQQSVNVSNLDAYINLANNVSEQFSLSSFESNEHTIRCLDEQNCEAKFIDELLPRLFRRDITIDEQARFSYFFDNTEFNTQDDPIAGFELALRTALTSPNFLFRFEMGAPIDNEENRFKLTSFEMASFLSYTYTGSTPDDELLTAARNNALQSDAQLLTQIERLLETEKAKIQMGEFAAQWMGSQSVLHASKDPELFPNFDDTVAASMNQQTKEIFKDAFFTQYRTFGDLYDTNFSMMDQVLLDFYSATVDSGTITDDSFSRVFLPEYAGLTTSSAFLTTNSGQAESLLISRAAFVREKMLCQTLPSFPSDVDLGTVRQLQADKVEEVYEENNGYISPAHLTFINVDAQACQGCHATILAPLGLGLEDYDAVGKHRDTYENGIAVDFTGYDETQASNHSALYGIDDIYDRQDPIAFQGAKALGEILAKSDTAKACYTEMAFIFTMGHGIQNNYYYGYNDIYSEEQSLSNTCAKNNMLNTMQENNDSLKSAFIQLGLSDIVRLRTHYTAEQ